MSELDKPASVTNQQTDTDAQSEPAAQGLDADLTREIESAMEGMSAEDLAALHGEDVQPARDDATAGARRIGKIVAIYDEDVFIDLGGKTQAIAPRSQFGREEVLEIGRKVEVIVDRFDPESGCVVVSRDGAVREARWESMAAGSIVEGPVTGMNKGGLEVNLGGIRAFMPASQVDIAHVKDISVFIGQKVRCEIMELDRSRRNVLVSRRKVLQREQAENKDKLLGELAEGQVRKGVVGNLTDFGAFVDLGGVDGLIHVSDLSYKQVGKVSDIVQPGQEVEVKVLKVDRGRERISLGLKQAQPDPWTDVEEKYPLQSEVSVRVLRLERFGAFVELEEGVEGLIPLSEMSWSRVGKASAVVQVGEVVKAVVIRVEGKARRIALSLKQVEEDPWAGVLSSFPADSVQTGKVTRCEAFGAFVELVPGVEGLVHISELSDQRVKKCEDVVKRGDEVSVRVLGVDTDARRISLSIKAAKEGYDAAPDPHVEGHESAAQKKKKRKRPLRGGLASHFEWQGNSLDLPP